MRNPFREQPPREEPIGEVFVQYGRYNGLMPAHSEAYTEGYQFWKKFYVSDRDVLKDHDGYVYLFGMHHKRENLFYYSNIYDPLRNKIEAKNKTKA